jgi:hypothetical protein
MYLDQGQSSNKYKNLTLSIFWYFNFGNHHLGTRVSVPEVTVCLSSSTIGLQEVDLRVYLLCVFLAAC